MIYEKKVRCGAFMDIQILQVILLLHGYFHGFVVLSKLQVYVKP